MDEFNPAYGMVKAAFDKFGGKAAEKPAETFALIYDHIIDPFHYKMKKVKFDRELDFQKYQDEVLNELDKIPENQFNEPSLSIIGPAIEASKYYINDDDIRSMFSKLLARSMHKGYSEIINHSFVEILKQLSPTDALILNHIFIEEHVPTVKITALSGSTMGINLTDFFMLLDDLEVESIQISLNNLKRLGVIEIPNYAPLSPSKVYQPFYDHQLFEELAQKNYMKDLNDEYIRAVHFQGINIDKMASDNGLDPKELETITNYNGIDIIKSRSSLTSYGKALAEVCLPD